MPFGMGSEGKLAKAACGIYSTSTMGVMIRSMRGAFTASLSLLQAAV